MRHKNVLNIKVGDVLTRVKDKSKCEVIGRSLYPVSCYHFRGFNVGYECIPKFFKSDNNLVEVE